MSPFFYFYSVKDPQKENKEKQEDGESQKNRKIQENANDLTDVLFDLFFDKNFKGNTDPKKGSQAE
jgi:hypothetical protein